MKKRFQLALLSLAVASSFSYAAQSSEPLDFEASLPQGAVVMATKNHKVNGENYRFIKYLNQVHKNLHT